MKVLVDPKAFQIGHPGAENKEKAEFIQEQGGFDS
jgi:hypothetical protein